MLPLVCLLSLRLFVHFFRVFVIPGSSSPYVSCLTRNWPSLQCLNRVRPSTSSAMNRSVSLPTVYRGRKTVCAQPLMHRVGPMACFINYPLYQNLSLPASESHDESLDDYGLSLLPPYSSNFNNLSRRPSGNVIQ